MHIFKAKATLSDYFDLNRRYFKITDIVLFEDNKVKLDVLPECYIDMISDRLLDIAFCKTELLQKNAPLKAIAAFFDIDIYELYERFNKLIDDKFDKDTLINLFNAFESRNDDEIRNMVTDNADIPTIFEYVLGVAWYIVSERKGDVLEYMNLSLEADLLPKTHAGGGEADIVWKYDKTEVYLKHTLLIEATLADGSNQRRMEDEAYCVFITTYLNNNVISDFRARKYMEYYNNAGEYIKGMKILPIETKELKTLLKFDVKYPQIYKMFDTAYHSEGAPKEWYENNIVKETGMYNGEVQ